MFNPITSKIIVSMDVTFYEAARWNWNVNRKTNAVPLVIYEDASKDASSLPDEANLASRSSATINTNNHGVSSPEDRTNKHNNVKGTSSDESPVRKVRLLEDIYASCTFALNMADPFTYEETIKEEVWRKAMIEELNTIR